MTQEQEIQKIIDNLKTALNIQNPDQSIIAQGYAFGIVSWILKKYIKDVQKNVSPATAFSEKDGGTLEMFGRFYLGRNPTPATQGTYTITVTGIIGGVIESGKQLRDDNNNIYQVNSNVTLISTTGIIEVTSVSAGSDSTLVIGQKVYFNSPIALVESEAYVDSVITEPFDQEDNEDYRDKIITNELAERQGGSPVDYRIWSYDATGVVQTYPYLASPSVINLYIEADTVNGVASQAVKDAVKDVINTDPDITKSNRGRRPIGVFLINYLSVTPITVDIELVNLRNLSDISAVSTAINQVLSGVRPHVDGADDPNEFNDVLSVGDLNCVAKRALSIGNSFDNIILKVNNNVVTTYKFLLGNIPYLNSVIAI